MDAIFALAFSLNVQKDARYWYAMCGHAALAAHGRTRAQALDRFKNGAQVYVEELIARDELERAVREGVLRVKSFSSRDFAGGPWKIGAFRGELTAALARIP